MCLRHLGRTYNILDVKMMYILLMYDVNMTYITLTYMAHVRRKYDLYIMYTAYVEHKYDVHAIYISV